MIDIENKLIKSIKGWIHYIKYPTKADRIAYPIAYEITLFVVFFVENYFPYFGGRAYK